MPLNSTSPKSGAAKAASAKTPRAAKSPAGGKSGQGARSKSADPTAEDVMKTPSKGAAARQAAIAADMGEAGDGLKAKGRGASVVKLKDLIDQVTEDSGAKKKDVKAIVEATLTRMAAALGKGESLSLQGFGFLRVARKATAETPVMTLKLRQGEGNKPQSKSAGNDDKDTLAEPGDQG